MSIKTAPEVIFRLLNASMEKEGVMVIPVKEREESPLHGMLANKSNGELHSERFSREKQLKRSWNFEKRLCLKWLRKRTD